MDQKNSLHFEGTIQSACASVKHPLQTNIRFILTDFLPNKNKEAIPYSEAENITTSAIGMPVKIRFDGVGAKGHAGSRPIGPITSAWVEDEKIIAEATIWNREFADVDVFLKEANAEEKSIGTSWEIFYGKDEKDGDGNTWFHDTVFAATTIVEKPAYGSTRTRIFAVSEMDEVSKTPEADKISSTVNDLYKLASILNEMWHEVYEEELAANTLDNATEVIDRARSILNTLRNNRKAMAEEKELLEQIEALKSENLALAEFKRGIEIERLFSARAEVLKDLFSAEDITTRKDMLIALSEEAFTAYVTDLKAVVRKPAQAETKENIRIPDLSGSAKLDISVLAQELNKVGVKK